MQQHIDEHRVNDNFPGQAALPQHGGGSLDRPLNNQAELPPATDHIKEACPLSGVLTSTEAAPITEDGTYRCYATSIRTSVPIHGIEQSGANTVIYRIGGRSDVGCNRLRYVRNINLLSLQGRFPMNPVYDSELTGFARKHTNFATSFRFCDYSAVLHRLGQCLTSYTLDGALSWADCMNGAALNLSSLQVLDEPVQASSTALFIPRVAATVGHGAAFAALVMAQNSTGGSVVTDVVDVDVETNAARITTFEGAELADGIVTAIRYLLGIMGSSGCLGLGAHALICGLHSVATVVGHTDEGAYLRSVLRRGQFRPSYGGVYLAPGVSFYGLPTVSRFSAGGFTALVDSMLLLSAGMAANCDPCVVVDGKTFPTVLTCSGPMQNAAGNDGTEANAREHTAQLASMCRPFCDLYVGKLNWMFGGGVEVNTTAASNLALQFGSLSGEDDRHLRHLVVSPFYWIEPSPLFKNLDLDSVAVRSGLGSLCATEVDGGVPYVEKAFNRYVRGQVSMHSVLHRTARTSGMILHHGGHVLNGLGSVVPRQAEFGNFALRGGDNEDIDISFNQNRDLARYLWGRGDAGVPAPAEFMYTGKAIGLLVVHEQLDPMTLSTTTNNIVGNGEMHEGTIVNVSTSVPQFIGILALGERPRVVRRARTGAAIALSDVRRAVAGGFLVGADMFPVTNSSPFIFGGDEERGQPAVGMAQNVMPPQVAPVRRQGPTARHVFHQAVQKVPAARAQPRVRRASLIEGLDALARAARADEEILEPGAGNDAGAAGVAHVPAAVPGGGNQEQGGAGNAPPAVQ